MTGLLDSRRKVAVLHLTRCVLFVVLALYAVRCLTPLGSMAPIWLDARFLEVSYGLSTLLVVLRVVWVRADRSAWSCMAVGLAAFSAATAYFHEVIVPSGSQSFPSYSDAGWVLFYPMAYVAVLLLLRGRLARFHASMWLDGVLAVLAFTSIASAFVLPVVLQGTGGDFKVVATNLAYPLGDLLLISILLGVFAMYGWRPDRTWWLLAGGLAMFAAADTGYLIKVAQQDYAPGSWIDLMWVSGVALPAFAAWRPMDETVRVRLEGWAVLAVPSVFTLLSLGLLSFAGVHPLPVAAVVLATASVLVAVVRTGLTFREVRALVSARMQARTDELTGLPNRRSFRERSQVVLQRCDPGSVAAFLLVDLDRFKEVNDSFGHPMGDALLRMIGPRLSSVVRSSDVIARLGGDEFGVVLPDADRAYAATIATRLREELRRPFELDGLKVHLDASIGIALSPQHGDGSDVLLQRADIAMYAAKRARTGYEIYQHDGDHFVRQRLETLEQLRAAITGDELVLHYQPKLHLPTGRIVGVEALVRWEHPVRGLVFPDAFVPLAEQAGLMRLLTLDVLQKALQQRRVWDEAGLTLSVAVNLSASNLLDAAFPGQVQLALETSGMPASALELEITENILMSDPDRAMHVLDGLRALGVRLSIDDYGTGYSSLAYLRALPVHELKLDRTFVTHMDTDSRSAAIALSTVELAHSLGMVMVAEGVEDQHTLDLLTSVGCDFAQGYHIARPQPPQRLTPWLLKYQAGALVGEPTSVTSLDVAAPRGDGSPEAPLVALT